MNRENPALAPGPLRNGNPRGNPNAAPRGGARTRTADQPCRSPAMANGRCRMHGGRSTGPRTAEGLERLRAARTIHGGYGAEARAFFRWVRELRLRADAFSALARLGSVRLKPGELRRRYGPPPFPPATTK